jgi:hypothetical protein
VFSFTASNRAGISFSGAALSCYQLSRISASFNCCLLSRIIQRSVEASERAAHLSHSLRPFCYIPRSLPSFFLLAGALNFENYGSISFHFPKQYLSSLLILLSEFQCKIESSRLFASEWRKRGKRVASFADAAPF